MCTVSVVPRDGGFRIACNRDERRTRPAALPPRIHCAGHITSVWPIDAASGGTWIGANDAGLAAVLLNRNPRPAFAAPPAALSRGLIVPRVLQATTIRAALETACSLPIDRFEPFTLAMVQGDELIRFSPLERTPIAHRFALVSPLMLTSSSLGDDVVITPRAALFDALLSRGDALAAQREFHHHRWPNRPEISVRMSRADACTVSHTILDVIGNRIRIEYTPWSCSPSSLRRSSLKI